MRLVLPDPAALLPEAWRSIAPVRCFNPALIGAESGWIFACRVVGADGMRRIAICRLDDSLGVVAGSALPLSDHLATLLPREVPRWFADPRLYRLDGRLWVYWNSGWPAGDNHQFMQELDPRTLLPRDRPRALLREGGRQPIEKNWTFFEADGLHAVYAPDPHAVMTLAGETDTSWLFRSTAAQPCTEERFRVRYGALRGGAPPLRRGAVFLSICHLLFPTALGHSYAAAAYAFAATPPFAPVATPQRTLRLGRADHAMPAEAPLNPAVHRVVYPCGAAWRDGLLLVSFGLDDARCGIALLPEEAIETTLRPMRHASEP